MFQTLVFFLYLFKYLYFMLILLLVKFFEFFQMVFLMLIKYAGLDAISDGLDWLPMIFQVLLDFLRSLDLFLEGLLLLYLKQRNTVAILAENLLSLFLFDYLLAFFCLIFLLDKHGFLYLVYFRQFCFLSLLFLFLLFELLEFLKPLNFIKPFSFSFVLLDLFLEQKVDNVGMVKFSYFFSSAFFSRLQNFSLRLFQFAILILDVWDRNTQRWKVVVKLMNFRLFAIFWYFLLRISVQRCWIYLGRRNVLLCDLWKFQLGWLLGRLLCILNRIFYPW